MCYPADAFVRVKAAEAPKGALVFIRDLWFLSTEILLPTGPKRKSLVLTGQQAGFLHDEFSDVGVSTAPGVEVQVRIQHPQARVSDGSYPQPGNVVIPPSGAPQIWSRLPDSEFYRRGFTLTGELVDGEDHDHQPFIYFKTYDVWLIREGKPLNDKPLFTVGA